MAESDPEEVRHECYDRITAVAQSGLRRYYQKFPDRIGDQRQKDAIEWSTAGVREIHAVLDDYIITRKLPLPETKP